MSEIDLSPASPLQNSPETELHDVHFHTALWAWRCVFWTVNYLAVTVPSIIINLLAINFQITLSLSSLLMALSFIVAGCFLVVRYRYLTRYSANTAPHTESQGNQLHRAAIMDNKKTLKKASSNYLDEFLRAIKVFGYLERPVFNELTKNMTTQKVALDEIICLDETLGFSIVVEGTVQVYVKVDNAHATETDDSELNYEKGDVLLIGRQRYQLLNEVKTGAPLSSLMNTLDLFKPPVSSLSSPVSPNVKPASPQIKPASPGPAQLNQFNLERASAPPLGIQRKVSFHVGQLSPDTTEDYPYTPTLDGHEDLIYPEVVAKAGSSKEKGEKGSATIAIIPRLAFQKVQTKYPKATSHIVTMVLTRLYKVTMNTVHNYLGLTKEILHSEVLLNSQDEEMGLPSYLYDGVVERFYGDGKSVDNQQTVKKHSAPSKYLTRQSSSRYVMLDSRLKPTHPGDLLSSVPLSRRPELTPAQLAQPDTFSDDSTLSSNKVSSPSPLYQALHPQSFKSAPSSANLSKSRGNNRNVSDIRDRTFSDEREETEETSLRTAIIENMFKLLGIDEAPAFPEGSWSFNSAYSSINSSTTGLTSLMNGDNYTHEGAFYDRGVYESVYKNAGLDSLNSLNSSLSNSAHGRHAPKFYTTIDESLMRTFDLGDKLPNQKRRKSSTNGPYDFNFNHAKTEFSKVLDIKYIEPDTTVVEQDSFNSGLYYVIDGSLDIFYQTLSKDFDAESQKVQKKLHTVQQGGLAGYLSSVVGFRSLVSIKTPKNKGTIVAHISKHDFSTLMDKFYFLQLPVATKLKSMLSRQILTIDFALEWVHIPAGNILCSQGDVANGFHVVLSGRFRVVRNNNFKPPQLADGVKNYNHNLIDESQKHDGGSKKDDFEVLGEYGHGESIGEVEVLTALRRPNSLIAVRDSETVRIPRTLFEMLSLKNPSIMVKVSRIVAGRMRDTLYNQTLLMSHSLAPIKTSTVPHISNDYKTITILPTVSGLPVREFAEKLVQALKTIGRKVIALDQTSTLTHLGRHAFDERLAQLKLSGYFAYLEEEYETIVYVCDTQLKSNWTATCISQGDCILLLADADDYDAATSVGDYERLLIKMKTTARTDICLIHPEKNVEPGLTSMWLKNRVWVQGHHHIQMEISRDNEKPKKKRPNLIRDLAARISEKSNPNLKLSFDKMRWNALSHLRIKKKQDLQYKLVQTHKNDFLRLARILSNEAVGLVLGGGGSRGISHVGVVMALEKHGIPVDLIGGTSIGSFVGGLYAKDNDIVSIYGRAKRFSMRVSSLWRSIFDLTYPVTSYITGYEFNRGIWKIFGSYEIEDFWVRYFCNSTNITNSTMEIHENGYAWRFIRALMSLAGLLPPITFKGLMLLDGGYLDNLPVLEMKKKGAKYIFAVDVGSVDDRTPMNYGDTLLGFWVLFNRWNPFSKHPNVPNMMDIQLRLAYVASVHALELAKKTPGVIYLRPPIDDYATLDFAKFDEIYHVGMAYADKLLTDFEQTKNFPQIAGVTEKAKIRSGAAKKLFRRNSI